MNNGPLGKPSLPKHCFLHISVELCPMAMSIELEIVAHHDSSCIEPLSLHLQRLFIEINFPLVHKLLGFRHGLDFIHKLPDLLHPFLTSFVQNLAKVSHQVEIGPHTIRQPSHLA